MTCDEALAFLTDHNDLHDSIVDHLSLLSSTRMTEDYSLAMKREGWNAVEIILSSQQGYRVRVKMDRVRRMTVHETYEDIVFAVRIKEHGDQVHFSLTGAFGVEHTWFEADEIEFEELTFEARPDPEPDEPGILRGPATPLPSVAK